MMIKSHSISRRSAIKLAAGAAVATNVSGLITGCTPTKSSFDYVIIGAGSAGCVLAARLTENSNTRVLLLEAGPLSSDPLIDDPKKWFRLTFGDYVWPDIGTPQEHADNKKLKPVHGKLVGGSSAINAMIHHRPTPQDIDNWNLLNWRWDDLKPMLMRSENYLDGPTKERGNSGPIKVMALPDAPPLADATLAAADGLGYGISSDINGEIQTGASLNQLAFDGQKRQHTGYAYLAPAIERTNLTLVTHAHVTKLNFDGNKCVGLEYKLNGKDLRIEAKKVILSAGALRSPALLLRSGIGPAAHLKELNVPIRIASEGVGRNLHDHVLVAGHNFATENKIEQSAVHGSVAIVYGKSEISNGVRDLMLNVSTTPSVLPPLHSPDHGFKTTFSFTKPKSRGELRLKDLNPFSQPLIDHNIFSHPDDMKGAMAALNLSREILGAASFDTFGGVEQNQLFLENQAAMRSLIVKGSTFFGHHSGTCRMGAGEDAVVDETLKVRGVEGLYVMDASVIPNIPSCPTNALVIAMAELSATKL